MADEIVRVTFNSKGAPVTAQQGTYPIVPTRAQVIVRGHYSIRYVNGTMTVGPPLTGIQFVRKAQVGKLNSVETGTQTFVLPVAPSAGNLLVAILAGQGVSGDDAPTLGGMTNGSGAAYTQIGGSGGQVAYSTTDGSEGNMHQIMSMWYRTTNAGTIVADGTVKFDVTTATPDDGNVRWQLIVLEYRGATTGSPLTDQVKGSHDSSTDDGTDGVNVFTLPDLDLDNTTGQAVVVAYMLDYFSSTFTAGYTDRYSLAGAGVLDALGIRVDDHVGLSGVGPEKPKLTLMPNTVLQGFCGIAAAFTKA